MTNVSVNECIATGLRCHRRVSQTSLAFFANQHFEKNSIVLSFRRDLESCNLNSGSTEPQWSIFVKQI